MDGIDMNRAQQVWQRVRGDSTAGDDRLNIRMQGLVEVYGLLSRQTRGRTMELLEQVRRDAACLRGIAKMTGQAPASAAPPQPRPEGRSLPAECCQRELAWMAELEKRNDSPYTPIFRLLRDRSRERLARVLTLLGSGQ